MQVPDARSIDSINMCIDMCIEMCMNEHRTDRDAHMSMCADHTHALTHKDMQMSMNMSIQLSTDVYRFASAPILANCPPESSKQT